MKSVLIEVKAGFAEVIRRPKRLNIEIVDVDLLRDGDVEGSRDYWNSSLSSTGRRYIKKRYPQ